MPACSLLLLLALMSPGAALAQEPARVPCRHDDKECAARALKDHAITKVDYWRAALARPLEQRISEAAPEVVEFLTLDNIQSGFPDKPRPAKLSREFLRDLRAAITELPPSVRRIVSGKLAGIHLVRDLGGTGYTDTIYDADSNAVAGFVVLDASVLEKRANAWATWKENTPFKPQSGFRLTALIETRSEDSRKNAIQYILLHELGHIVSVGEKIHPSWNVEPKDASTDYPYFSLSWTVAKEDNR
jgi:hypothetical protein